jgi:hypothetical protein
MLDIRASCAFLVPASDFAWWQTSILVVVANGIASRGVSVTIS